MKKKLESKLVLKKETIEQLDNDQMNGVKGGFTYSLSLGARCRKSRMLQPTNPVNCKNRPERAL